MHVIKVMDIVYCCNIQIIVYGIYFKIESYREIVD